MAWKPIGNVLAVIDVMGKYGLWELVVPSSMKSPTEDIPSLKNSNGVLLFDEEDPEPSTSGGSSEFAEDILCEPEPVAGRDYVNSLNLNIQARTLMMS